MIEKLKKKIRQLFRSRNDDWQAEFSEEEFLELIYSLVLCRPPDAEGKRFYLDLLKERKTNRRNIIKTLIASPEFELAGCSPLDALHIARCKYIKMFPYAETIIDLGGSCENRPEGALYVMGYPFRAKRLYIVDLPPAERMTKASESADNLQFDFEGTTVQYIYGSMSDLSFFKNESADMIVSGESIEHVSEEDGDKTLIQCHRILKKGGFLMLDTPNRLVTGIQLPNKLIHPEHKKEYTPLEIRAKIRRAGFEIMRELGICPFSKTLAAKRFIEEEFFSTPQLSIKADDGYLMGFFCVKK